MLNKHWLINDHLLNWWCLSLNYWYVVNNSISLDMQQERSIVHGADVIETSAAAAFSLH